MSEEQVERNGVYRGGPMTPTQEERLTAYIEKAKSLYENKTFVVDDNDIAIEDDLLSVVEDEEGAYIVALVRVPKSALGKERV